MMPRFSSYSSKGNRVEATPSDSSTLNRLKQIHEDYKELERLKLQVKELEKKMESHKDFISSLFYSTQRLFTCVLNASRSLKFIITLSKSSERKNVKYAEILKNLETKFTPEMKKFYEELLVKYTSYTSVSSKISIKHLGESNENESLLDDILEMEEELKVLLAPLVMDAKNILM